MKKHIEIFSVLAVMLAAFLWAFDGVVLTPWILDLGLSDVPTFVFMLHAVASIFLSYFFFKKRDQLKNLDKKDWLALILTSLFGGAIGTMAIIAAIVIVHTGHLNISVVLLLQKLQPIFAILLALLWLKERPKKMFYFWAFVALIGSYILTFGFSQPDFDTTSMFIPAMLAMLAAFSFGSSTVFSKKAVTKISHSLGTALRFYLTTGIMAIIIIVISILNSAGVNTNYQGINGFEAINWSLIGAFIIVALTTGGTSILLYYWGLKKILASQSTIYEMTFPVSAVVLEFIFHDNIFSIEQWVGAIVVLFAISIIVRTKI